MNKKPLLFLFRIVTLLVFVIASLLCVWYIHLNHSIIPTYKKTLWDMALKRADEIDTFLNEQETNAITLSEKPIIIETFQNPSAAKEKITEFIESYKATMAFKNILLIDNQGKV